MNNLLYIRKSLVEYLHIKDIWLLVDMKICFLVDSYKPIYDGVIRYLDLVSEALIKDGHEIAIVCPQIPGTAKYENPHHGLRVVRCPTPGWYAQGYFIALPDYDLVKEVRKADFVVIHSVATLGVIGGIIAKLLRKKTALFVHQDERLVLREMLNNPQWVVNLTAAVLSEFFYPGCIDVFFHATERFKMKLIDLKVPDKKIFFTPFAVDRKEFNPENKKFDIRKQHNIPEDAIVSLFVGRISIEKNIERLLQATDLAMDENPKLYGIFVGKKTQMEVVTKKRKNANRIIFTGFVPDEELPSYYNASDFFTSPSINESTCFTVYEAMSCKTPTIISGDRHDQEIIHKENTILVMNLRSVSKIKEAILLLANDKPLRNKIAKKAKQLIDTRTWEYHVQEVKRGIKFAFRPKGRRKRSTS